MDASPLFAPMPLALSWRRPGCGIACRRERVVVVGGVGTQQGVVWREYHDAAVHDRRADELTVGLLAALAIVPVEARRMVRTGSLVVDLVERRVWEQGREVHLTPTGFAILVALASQLGRPVAHDDLLAVVWPENVSRRPGPPEPLVSPIPHQKLRNHVSRLRTALGTAGGLVETRLHFGYLLASAPSIDMDGQVDGDV